MPQTTQARDTTVEELLEQIQRMAGSEPHARCREGSGPLAPLAVALNALSTQLFSRQPEPEEDFGLRALVEQSPNIMVTCDREARVRYVNYTPPGLTVEQALGMSVYDLTAPESRDEARTVIERVLATGEPAGYEGRPARGIGGTEWYAARVAPLQVGASVIGFTLVIIDVTGLKQTQSRLEQSNRELESFAYVASHDLQEPLRKIQTFGERLRKSAASALGPEAQDSLERMLGAATRMRRLIDDLLAFSRVSANARPFTQVALSTIAHEVVEDLAAPIEQTGARVTLFGALPTLEADPTQMRQLIQNLVGNALKFRREGVVPTVSVSATVPPQSGWCELVVADNGIGFEEKYRERIFQVFQRLHGRGQYEGTGIGLAVCRKIAERHHGTIQARSTPGVGTSFHVSLPLVQPTPI